MTVLVVDASVWVSAADALYAAAENAGGDIVAWDEELVRRAGAFTPEAWLARHGGG